MDLIYSHSNYSFSNEEKTVKSYPVILEEARRHLRMDTELTDDNDYIDGLIAAATGMAENYIEKKIAKTEVTLTMEGSPSTGSLVFSGDWFRVNEGNFLSLISLTDINDVSIGEVDSVRVHDDFFQINLKNSITVSSIKLKYYAGFEPGECPPVIKQAILIKLADLYDSARSDYSWKGMADNKVFESILNFFKIIRF